MSKEQRAQREEKFKGLRDFLDDIQRLTEDLAADRDMAQDALSSAVDERNNERDEWASVAQNWEDQAIAARKERDDALAELAKAKTERNSAKRQGSPVWSVAYAVRFDSQLEHGRTREEAHENAKRIADAAVEQMAERGLL